MRTGAALVGLVGLAAGCGQGLYTGDGVGFASRRIGPEGGDLVLQEATLTIPAGAIVDEMLVDVRRLPETPAGAVGAVFRFGPDGHMLQTPARLAITVDGSLGLPRDRVKIGHFSDGHWGRVNDSIGFDPAGGQRVIGEAMSLRQYAPVLYCGNNAECGTGLCYAGVCQ